MSFDLSCRLTEIWMTCRSNFIDIRSFRKFAMAGVPLVASREFEVAKRFPRELDASGWHFPNREHALSEEFAQEFATAATTSKVARSTAATDSAALDFAHSIVDDIAKECCKISSLADPAGWNDAIGKKKVELKEIAATGYDGAYAKVLEEHIDVLSRESLLRRVDVLNAKCQPVPPFVQDGQPYTFDRERLKILDQLRHEIIHGVAIAKGVPSIEGELIYLEMTGLFLLWLVHRKYRIELDLQSYLRRKTGTTPSSEA
jgi:hypothetical protein